MTRYLILLLVCLVGCHGNQPKPLAPVLNTNDVPWQIDPGNELQIQVKDIEPDAQCFQNTATKVVICYQDGGWAWLQSNIEPYTVITAGSDQ